MLEAKVTPQIVDEKVHRRDTLKKTITISNTGKRKLFLYASVNDVDPASGRAEFTVLQGDDLSASLANWIEISRGLIELNPGESTDVPYLIQVNLRAAPGLYHAFITFTEGSTRAEAESHFSEGKTVAVNVEVLDDGKTELDLSSFAAKHSFFLGSVASFAFRLENTGNRPVTPHGEIRIYNSRGEEVATLDANARSMSFAPNVSGELAAVWDAIGRFGPYKAHLALQFGEKDSQTLQDTVFFWIMPWYMAVILSIVITGLSGGVLWYIHRRYQFIHLSHLRALGFTGHLPLPTTPSTESVAIPKSKVERNTYREIIRKIFVYARLFPAYGFYVLKISWWFILYLKDKIVFLVGFVRRGKRMAQLSPQKTEISVPQESEDTVPSAKTPHLEAAAVATQLRPVPRVLPKEPTERVRQYGAVVEIPKRDGLLQQRHFTVNLKEQK